MRGFDPHPRLKMGAKRSFFWEDLPPEKLWYMVGLVTSDGCLSPDGRHIDITAKEKDYLQQLKEALNITVSIGEKKNGRDASSYRLQIGSISLYRFLQDVGLTPNKSKTISKLKVPDEWFSHFLRGVIDGDGCIRKWCSPSGAIQWYVKINSGSEVFLSWLKSRISQLLKSTAHIHYEEYKVSAGYILKISRRHDVHKVLTACYANNNIALNRKKLKALQFINE